MKFLADPHDELSRVLLACCRGRERLSVLFVDLDPFIYCLAKFLVDVRFVISVNAAQHEARTSAHIAVIHV
jgi:hypothetical protein